MLLMLSKFKFIGSAAIICVALNGCGGGSTDSAEPIKPESFNLTTVISSGSGTIQPSNVTATAGSNVEFTMAFTAEIRETHIHHRILNTKQ